MVGKRVFLAKDAAIVEKLSGGVATAIGSVAQRLRNRYVGGVLLWSSGRLPLQCSWFIEGHLMRTILLALFLAISCATYAQTPGKPPALQPIPEPPPPPPGFELDPALEPQITILKRGVDTVEEHRIGGRLYMVKVTPPNGRPYYLIDHRGDGMFTRQDSFDSGVRVPMWVIHSF